MHRSSVPIRKEEFVTDRIRYFDIAKGIAILAVLLGHSILECASFASVGMISNLVYETIFTFHMPLFFILSGYFMHPERSFRWRKESRELLATYAITAAVVIVGVSVVAWFMRTGTKQTFATWFTAAYYGAGDIVANTLWPVTSRIGAIWFLLALFWAHLFVHATARVRFQLVLVVLLFLTGFLSTPIFWFPLSIQSGACAALFVYIGTLLRRYEAFTWLRHHWYVAIPIAMIWIADIALFSGFGMAVNGYGEHPLLTIAGAIAGTICVTMVCMAIDHFANPVADVLARYGTASLALLCVHLIEDDVTPWNLAMPALYSLTDGLRGTAFILFLIRLCIDTLLVWGLYHVPGVNALFFPQLAKSKVPFQPPLPPKSA